MRRYSLGRPVLSRILSPRNTIPNVVGSPVVLTNTGKLLNDRPHQKMEYDDLLDQLVPIGI